MSHHLEQQQLEEISREQREMEREQVLDAIDDFGNASLNYGIAIHSQDGALSVLDAGDRKDRAYHALVKLVNRVLR